MSAFTQFNDKNDTANFLMRRNPLAKDRPFERLTPVVSAASQEAGAQCHSEGDAEEQRTTENDDVTISVCPLDSYQDQIQKWLTKASASQSEETELTLQQAHPNGAEHRSSSQEDDIGPLPCSRSRRGSFIGSVQGSLGSRRGSKGSRRGSSNGTDQDAFGRTGSKLGSWKEAVSNSFKAINLKTRTFGGDGPRGSLNPRDRSTSKGQDAWRRVQEIIRFGGVKLESSDSHRPQRRLVRLRGLQLGKPLREVTKQREVVKEINNEDVVDKAANRPSWGSPDAANPRSEEEDESLERVEEIVSKASTYIGPKTLQSEEEGSLLYWLSMTTPYLKVGGFVLLSAVDLVLALIFHVFWTRNDFMCDFDTPQPQPEKVVLGLLAAVSLLHFNRTLSKLVKTDGGGEFVGLRYFYSKELFGYTGLWVNNADFWLNAVSATVLALHAMDCNSADPDETTHSLYHIIVRRIHGHVHLIRSLFAFQRCFSMNEYLRQQLQIAVSVNKRRFISADTNINLDLTYICDRLIAMAIPVVDYVMYRNDIRDVARFFAAFHYGTFLVYNLCEGHEEGGNGNYDTSLLYNQVQHVSFCDHNVPRFRCIVKFCETASAWLNAGDKNVVAVHCQGGKGRTGTFCSSLMLWTGYCDTAQEALDKFALRRTQRMRYGEQLQGVSSPSQIRYVHYLEAYIYEGVDYQVSHFKIMNQITLYNLKSACMKGQSLSFVVEVDGSTHYDYGKEHGFLNWEACERNGFIFELGDLVVAGDVTVRFFLFDETEAATFASHNRPGAIRSVLCEGARTCKYGSISGKQMLFCSFHTAFHRSNVSFMKNEIDVAYHSTEETYGDNFSITMHFRQGKHGDEPSPQGNSVAKPSVSSQLKGLEEFLPRKTNSALQFLHTRDRVKELFEKMCPDPVVVSNGESVLEHTKPGYITMHYVISGTTSTQKPSPFVTMQSIKGVFEGELHGAGDILHRGMEKFTCGPREEVYAGGNSALVTRIVELPLTPDGFLGLECPGLDSQDLASLYSYLAQQVSARSRKYRDKISSLNHMNATKRTTQLAENRGNKKMLSQLRDRFGIEKTETLSCGSQADFERLAGSGNFMPGQAYVVSNWVLFFTKRSIRTCFQSKEVIVRIHDIRTADSNGDILSVTLDHGVRESMASEVQGSESHSVAESNTDLSSSGIRRIASKHLQGLMRRQAAATKKRKGHVGLMQKRYVEGDVTLRFPCEETCEAFARAINERMREMTNDRNKHHANDMSALKFGYILPSERDDEGGKAFLQHLLNISEVRSYHPGEEIIALGDPQRNIYHVISGTALRYSNANNHMEDIGPGEMVGEWRFLAFNSGFAETSQVVASTEVKCFVSPFEQVQTLCTLRKEFAVRFYRGLALSCIIRARQFKRLYQQNLQRVRGEKETESVRMSKRYTTRSSGHRLSFSSSVFQSTANLFSHSRDSSSTHGTHNVSSISAGFGDSGHDVLNPRNASPVVHHRASLLRAQTSTKYLLKKENGANSVRRQSTPK